MTYSFPTQTSPQSIHLLDLNCEPTIDKNLQSIGVYLADGLNSAYSHFFELEIAVRQVLSYDAVNVDLSSFPLLKIYRISDSFIDQMRLSNCVISYCLTYPDIDRLPGCLNWISCALNKLLIAYNISHEHCSSNIVIDDSFKTDYKIMVNEIYNPVYAFLRFSFKLKEIC